MNAESWDVAVVGGGLGGLAAATLLARRGLRVVLLERATTLGGRAATQERQGFLFNEGAHALYAGGAASRVLQRIGIRPRGARPPNGGLAVREGRTYALPATVGALLATRLLGLSSKLQGARLFARLGGFDAKKLAGMAWSDWLRQQVPDPEMRAAIDAFVRVATYANDPARISAGATLEQLRLAQRPGVLYLDGGWQSLVDAAADGARAAGAQLRPRARVMCAVPDGGGGWRTSLAGGISIDSRFLVLATGPATARSIVASEALAGWADRATPARVACLDVALARLPDERTTFALGIDRPLYLSVHSRTARLAPPGAGALVSAMKYLPTGDASSPKRDEAELEAWLDLLQPGWRDALIERRWLPSMIATNSIVTAAGGGTAGRPGPRVTDAPGVFVVGDWVGDEGMLLDASLASAERADEEIASDLVAKVA